MVEDSPTPKPADVLRESTYFDTMAVAVAQTTSERFRNGDVLWHNAFREAKIRLQETHPEVLRDLTFEEFGAGRFVSDQVEGFMGSMRRSGCMSVWGPRYQIAEVTQEAKEQIIRGNPKVIERHAEAVEIIAATLDERLGIK